MRAMQAQTLMGPPAARRRKIVTSEPSVPSDREAFGDASSSPASSHPDARAALPTVRLGSGSSLVLSFAGGRLAADGKGKKKSVKRARTGATGKNGTIIPSRAQTKTQTKLRNHTSRGGAASKTKAKDTNSMVRR